MRAPTVQYSNVWFISYDIKESIFAPLLSTLCTGNHSHIDSFAGVVLRQWGSANV